MQRRRRLPLVGLDQIASALDSDDESRIRHVLAKRRAELVAAIDADTARLERIMKRACHEVLALPVYPELPQEQVRYVAKELLAAVG